LERSEGMAQQVVIRMPPRDSKTAHLIRQRIACQTLEQTLHPLAAVRGWLTLARCFESAMRQLREFANRPAPLSRVQLSERRSEAFARKAELFQTNCSQRGRKVAYCGKDPLRLRVRCTIEKNRKFPDRLLSIQKVEVLGMIHTCLVRYTIEPRLRT